MRTRSSFERAAAEVVEHAARRAADDLRARAQQLDLPAHRRAAVDGRDRDAPVRGDLAPARRATCSASSRVGSSTSACTTPSSGFTTSLTNGMPNAAVLPVPGAGLDHQVAALARLGQRRGLNGHRFLKAHLVDGAEHLGAQAQVREAGPLGHGRRGGAVADTLAGRTPAATVSADAGVGGGVGEGAKGLLGCSSFIWLVS